MRGVAVFALLIGVSLFVTYLHLVGKAPFDPLRARHLREMKDRLAVPAAYGPITFDSIAVLPRRQPVAVCAPIERRAVSLEGYVNRILHATDGDFHLEIRSAPEEQATPQVYQTAEITPGWRRRGAGGGTDPSRGWSFQHLDAVFRPNHSDLGPAWDAGPARVRISGWLLYDYAFEDELDRLGHRRDPRLSGWEIHPVTRIERWSDARQAWVEVAP
jgi:hypothetical protein